MATDNPTTEHNFLDPVFKEVLTANFGQLAIPIQTQVEVSRLPRTIDALLVLETAQQRERVQTQTAFNYFRRYNQIEFKGKADALTRDGYHLIRGRSHLYLAEQKLSAADMTVTIVSARQPRNVLSRCPSDVRWDCVGIGHYQSMDLLPVNLFVCNELELVAKNYPLLLFASSKRKFYPFVEQLIGEDNLAYLSYAARVAPEITMEVFKMAKRENLYDKQLRRIIDVMGPDLLKKMTPQERFQGMTPGERLEGMTLQERLEGMTLQERLEGMTLQERLAGLSSEDLRALDPETKAELLKLLT